MNLLSNQMRYRNESINEDILNQELKFASPMLKELWKTGFKIALRLNLDPKTQAAVYHVSEERLTSLTCRNYKN